VNYLTLSNGNAVVVQTNADGFIVYEVTLGEAHDIETAENLASEAGWESEDDWDDFQYLPIRPAPVGITFFGDEVPEDALEIVHLSKVPAVEVIGSEYQDETAQILVFFSLKEPFGWDWGKPSEFVEDL
jgi:hypothetical protein